MTAPYKPEGYTSASPYLIVDGAQTVIDFLMRTFDAVPLRRYEDDAGRLVHAEVRVDDTVVMLADSVPAWPPQLAHVHVYVRDVDATYRRALEAGGTRVQEPVKKDGDADKRGGVKDPGGNTWWIATQVE
jgi:uncharacterized glyoxalase superfamily protein PhnB